MIVKKMPILQGFPDFKTVKFFTGKFFQKYNFTPAFYDIETTGLSRNSTYLYLIGAVGIEDETWNFYQWMAENANEEETEIDLLELFYYLKAKLVWLISFFVIGAVIAGLITYFLITPKYTATSKLYMVSASSDSIVNLSDLNLGTSLTDDYVELLKIRPIFEEIIKELDLDYTYDELLSMTSIASLNKTRLLGITVESTDPVEARDIANALANKAVSYVPEVMETATPNIAELAITPKFKSSPSLPKNTIIGALLGLVLAAGVCTVRFLMDDTFKSAEDVEKTFGVMPLTIIPEGNLEGIDDKAEQEIRKQKKKERKKRKKEAANE